MLIEATTLAGKRRGYVIGCGINCAHHPEQGLYPATDLQAEGYAVSPDELFEQLNRSMAQILPIWQGEGGFASIRREWLSCATGIGGPVTARFENHTISGTFEALDTQGHLILRDDEGTRHEIVAADIFFETA